MEETGNFGFGTTDPKFKIHVVDAGREILRVTPEGQMIPGDNLTLSEAIQFMIQMVEQEAIVRARETLYAGVTKCPDCHTEGLTRASDGAVIHKMPYTRTKQCEVCKSRK